MLPKSLTMPMDHHISFWLRRARAHGVGALLAAVCAVALVAMPQAVVARGVQAVPLAAPAALAQAPDAASTLVALSHPEGQRRLLESAHRQAYWPLASYFETQLNQAYCAVASSVIALNALGVPRPATSLYPSYPFFTQQGFFAGVDPAIATPDQVAQEGMTLGQLHAALAQHPVAVDKVPADTLDASQLRALLQQHLGAPQRVVLLNFNRRLIGQVGGGHWSPLAAYHAASDSVLLLDVARYRYPPVWVPLPDLLRAAQHHDTVSGQARGLLLVQPR